MSDIVLDSRVRLARNLKKYIFPDRASDTELAAVLAEGQRVMPSLNTLGHGTYEYIALADLTAAEREMLVEKHICSAAHVAKPAQRGLMLRNDGAVSVMINEEDHFCIHAAASGLNLDKVWEEVSQVDDSLESLLNFAFRDDFGYLTASPAMAGTGLIAAVTLHLPALVMMKRISRIVQGVTKLGFVVCGMYGDRGESIGNVFQITNQVTLGISEEDILAQLKKIVNQIVQEEKHCRNILWSQNSNTLQDKLRRTYGVLSQAWLMDAREAVLLLSDLRLAIDLGIVHERPLVYEALLAVIEPAYLQQQAGKAELTEEELNQWRAKLIRQTLAAYAV
jgi:protein arginine kinase